MFTEIAVLIKKPQLDGDRLPAESAGVTKIGELEGSLLDVTTLRPLPAVPSALSLSSHSALAGRVKEGTLKGPLRKRVTKSENLKQD